MRIFYHAFPPVPRPGFPVALNMLTFVSLKTRMFMAIDVLTGCAMIVSAVNRGGFVMLQKNVLEYLERGADICPVIAREEGFVFPLNSPEFSRRP